MSSYILSVFLYSLEIARYVDMLGMYILCVCDVLYRPCMQGVVSIDIGKTLANFIKWRP